jgi:hypothetical protein
MPRFKTKNAPLEEKQQFASSDFILTYPNNLDRDFCEHCIEKFENDPDVAPGSIGTKWIVDQTIKTSDDLFISTNNWKDEDKVFYTALNKGLDDWCDRFCHPESGYFWSMPPFVDRGYQIQRTKPGGYYHWHTDYNLEKEFGVRLLTFIWYLNDIKEDGYTEFIDGTKIQPECGKLLLFPATWTYLHRGFPPKTETKYIVTGWLYDKTFNEPFKKPNP